MNMTAEFGNAQRGNSRMLTLVRSGSAMVTDACAAALRAACCAPQLGRWASPAKTGATADV
jgi:hypothetical protein